MNGYSALAKVYDQLMSDFDYDGYYEFVKDEITGLVVELAIGSAEFTKRYITKVSRVIGVDTSAEMLNCASKKLTKHRQKTILVQDDIMLFSPQHSVDCVICVCDGLNYVKDICLALDKIDKYIKTGGKLIFDISSYSKLTKVIANNTFFEDNKDVYYIWNNKLDGNRVDMDLTIFRQDENGYIRSDESQSQYAHKLIDVKDKLNNLGYDFLSVNGEKYHIEAKDDDNRWLFLATKQ